MTALTEQCCARVELTGGSAQQSDEDGGNHFDVVDDGCEL